jgi:hypothetical protein
MFIPDLPLSRSYAWDVHGRRFRMSMAGDRLTLHTSDGNLSLSRHEWQAVAAALAALHPPAPRATPAPASNGRAWGEALDRDLAQGWYAGEGLAALAARLGRTEGSIASRLARLDIVADREEARQRP